MINGQLKSDIDKLWDEFWSGGVTNPLSVIEQISFLMFARLLDIRETREQKKAARTGKERNGIFSDSEQGLRWSHFKDMPAESMLPHVRDRVFPHFKTVTVDGTRFAEYMKDAQLLIQKPNLLVTAVLTIDKLPLTAGDTKGDLYEYMLGKLTTAGIAGQFRTPRHIIARMVEMLAPRPDEVVGDPACGTAGFLVAVMHYLLKEYTSPGMEYPDEDGNLIYPGDKLERFRDHIQTGLLHGFDFDATMLRIAAMNLLLHNIDSPDIHYMDTLSNRFPDSKEVGKLSEDFFDVVLANPPFKGSLDYDDVHPSLLKKVKTKKTELLFVALILKMLKNGGRSATIVPDGVLFGSSKAHQALRKMLVDDNQLEAVISLPSGVFKPYAGVSTGIIVFTRGGKTDNVFYYDVQADGFSLDDKREPQPDKDDLPEMLERWQKRDPKKDTDRTQKHFFVSADDIRKNKYDLSINRYKEVVYEEEEYGPAPGDSGPDGGAGEGDYGGYGGVAGDGGMSWKKVSVGEICSVVTKGTTPTTLGMSYVERGIPFLRAQNLQDGKVVLGKDTLYIDQKTNQALSRSIIQENDILLSIAGTIGRSAIVPKGTPQLNCNQAVAILRPTSKINPKFLRLCLDSIDSQAQINGSKVTATISNLSLSQIKGLKIPLPPLPDQKRIAAILDKADVIRRKRRQALKLADDFLRATFLDMFGDPVTNPKGWEVKPLSELCDVRDGTHDSPKYVQDGYPLITSKNVKNGKLDFSEVNLISEDDFLQINKRSAVDVGDIIMPMIGTIGNPVLVETSRKFAIKNVALIKFIQTSIKNDYILHLLKSHYFEWIIQRSNRGGTQKFIALKDIRSFPIPVPDIRQQSKFSDLRMKIKAVNASEDELGSASDTLFNSLTQRAFRGEL